MSERPRSHDLLCVHTDIPAGITIQEWRALGAVNSTELRRRSVLVGCRQRVGPAVTRIWVDAVRVLARPRITRARVLSGGRHRAPRAAAPFEPRSPSLTVEPARRGGRA